MLIEQRRDTGEGRGGGVTYMTHRIQGAAVTWFDGCTEHPRQGICGWRTGWCNSGRHP